MNVISFMTMLDISQQGFQVKREICGFGELLSAYQIHSFGGPVLAMCDTFPSNTHGTHCGVICIDNKARRTLLNSHSRCLLLVSDSMEYMRQCIYNYFQPQDPMSSDTKVFFYCRNCGNNPNSLGAGYLLPELSNVLHEFVTEYGTEITSGKLSRTIKNY